METALSTLTSKRRAAQRTNPFTCLVSLRQLIAQTLAGSLVRCPVAAMLCDGGNTVMIAVTISVAMSTRRSRIAVVIWFTPTADGAGSCVPGPRHGERFAVAGLFRGRSRVVHHLLVVVQRVTDPPDIGAAPATQPGTQACATHLGKVGS